jgi:recombination protein U
MKEMYGRQYLKAEDIEEYKVRFDGAVHFLQNIDTGIFAEGQA